MFTDTTESATSEVTTLLSTFTAPAIGTHWVEQGGIYAGLVRGEPGQPDQRLIVCAGDAFAITGEWGEYNQDVTGARSRFDGAANTRAMADAGSKLAKAVLAMECAGHRDLFIPSQAQAQLAAANVHEHLGAGWHWTSTQHSRSSAFVQGFEYGYSYWYDKDDEHRVRAFRAIPLQPLTT
jgi:hypothetical protein